MNVLKNKYSAIKSCVSVSSVKTDFFVCNKGLRQGEQLSPILFYLFLNDLDNYIAQTNVNNLNIVDNNLDTFLKLVALLYADDTVVFPMLKLGWYLLCKLLQTFVIPGN